MLTRAAYNYFTDTNAYVIRRTPCCRSCSANQHGRQVVLTHVMLSLRSRYLRFKGDMFCNIFTHFAPHDWKGPGHGAMNRPLEHMYYGYQPGRCNTLADDPSKGVRVRIEVSLYTRRRVCCGVCLCVFV